MKEDNELLAIIEIPKSKKVLCQHTGCGRAVYKKVHVFRNKGQIKIYGSECAKKLLGQRLKTKTPLIQSSGGISLSEADVELLLKNTEELIVDLEKRYKNPIEIKEPQQDFSKMGNKALEIYCLNEAKRRFREERGLNPDLPGWVGLVKAEANKLYKELSSSN